MSHIPHPFSGPIDRSAQVLYRSKSPNSVVSFFLHVGVRRAREAAARAGGLFTNHPGLGGNAWAPLDVAGVEIVCSELARLPLDVAAKAPRAHS